MQKYDRRDEDKIKTDKAKNDFEASIYSTRDWIQEDENQEFIEKSYKEEFLAKLYSEEEWLVDGEGDSADYLEFNKRFNEIDMQLKKLMARKSESVARDEAV